MFLFNGLNFIYWFNVKVFLITLPCILIFDTNRSFIYTLLTELFYFTSNKWLYLILTCLYSMIWWFTIVSTSKYTIYSNLDAYTLGMMRTLYMKHFIILILLFIRISSSDFIIIPVEWLLTLSLPSLTSDFRPGFFSVLTNLGSPTSISSLFSFSQRRHLSRNPHYHSSITCRRT